MRGCSESPAGNQAHCLQPDALPRPEEHQQKQKEQTRLFLLTATRQRCVLRNSPFSRHIWDHLAEPAESSHPRIQTQLALSSIPENTREVAVT